MPTVDGWAALQPGHLTAGLLHDHARRRPVPLKARALLDQAPRPHHERRAGAPTRRRSLGSPWHRRPPDGVRRRRYLPVGRTPRGLHAGRTTRRAGRRPRPRSAARCTRRRRRARRGSARRVPARRRLPSAPALLGHGRAGVRSVSSRAAPPRRTCGFRRSGRRPTRNHWSRPSHRPPPRGPRRRTPSTSAAARMASSAAASTSVTGVASALSWTCCRPPKAARVTAAAASASSSARAQVGLVLPAVRRFGTGRHGQPEDRQGGRPHRRSVAVTRAGRSPIVDHPGTAGAFGHFRSPCDYTGRSHGGRGGVVSAGRRTGPTVVRTRPRASAGGRRGRAAPGAHAARHLHGVGRRRHPDGRARRISCCRIPRATSPSSSSDCSSTRPSAVLVARSHFTVAAWVFLSYFILVPLSGLIAGDEPRTGRRAVRHRSSRCWLPSCSLPAMCWSPSASPSSTSSSSSRTAVGPDLGVDELTVYTVILLGIVGAAAVVLTVVIDGAFDEANRTSVEAQRLADELQVANTELEERVRSRTTELADALQREQRLSAQLGRAVRPRLAHRTAQPAAHGRDHRSHVPLRDAQRTSAERRHHRPRRLQARQRPLHAPGR